MCYIDEDHFTVKKEKNAITESISMVDNFEKLSPVIIDLLGSLSNHLAQISGNDRKIAIEALKQVYILSNDCFMFYMTIHLLDSSTA